MTTIRYALILVLVFLPASPFATTFPVTKTADTDDGTCDPDCSLREAIDAANTNPGADDVPVPAGTYLLTLGQLVVSDDVSIAGAGQATTIIDGNATTGVLHIGATSGGVEISDVTIQNGHAYKGGGISGRYFTLIDSTVSGNTAVGFGGGIAGSFFTLTNSTVSGNTAYGSYGGGGIFNDGVGGIMNDGGDVTLTNSTVSGNTSSGIGGGIVNWGEDLTLINSTVSGNNAYGGGGGIFSSPYFNVGTLTLINSTVSGNNTYGSGGGIWSNISLTLANSTVSGNTAYQYGGIYSLHYRLTNITNTIVADNGADNCNSGVTSFGHNLADDTSCPFTEPSDLVVADAMLGPLQDNGGSTETHDPLPGSPAIDAGGNCPPPATDQRGVARPQGAACDIGSVESLSEKVTMCHNGKHSISVSANAVPPHLAHGDTLGACP